MERLVGIELSEVSLKLNDPPADNRFLLNISFIASVGMQVWDRQQATAGISNRMVCCQGPILVLTVYHTSELAISLAGSQKKTVARRKGKNKCTFDIAERAALAEV